MSRVMAFGGFLCEGFLGFRGSGIWVWGLGLCA